MKKIRPGRSILRFAFSAGLAAFYSWVPVARAVGEDLSGFSVMLQRGDTSHPDAIEIAPDGRWFLTAREGLFESPIYLSDLESGAVLRSLIVPGRIRRVAISKDGRTVFAEYTSYNELGDNGPEEVLGWNAETGQPIAHAETAAPAPDDPNWSLIEKNWPSTNGPPYDSYAPKKYLVDQKIDRLVDVNRVERVEPTNRRNIVQVTLAGEAYDGDNAFAAYRFYFIDVIQKTTVAEVSGKTLNTFCGQPHGAFAFNGHYLIVAPTELDASSSFINSIVVDTEANPPVLKWSRPCQDYQVSGMAMQKGMIVASPQPDRVRIWDPATARPLAVLDDIYDSDVLTWSRDLTTFATGFHEALGNNQGDKFGVSVLRSGKKLFITTSQEVKEIRLNPDGSAVFARTQAGWAGWDTSSGASLTFDTPPPSDEDLRTPSTRDFVSPDGKFRIIDDRQLVDAASGRILVRALNMNLSDGSRYVWAWSEFESIIVWDAASGQKLWTATANDTNGEDFLFLEFPDGRVRLSASAERLVKLVRGFQVRPFDDAAKGAFVHP
jgi:hypothetical protein